MSDLVYIAIFFLITGLVGLGVACVSAATFNSISAALQFYKKQFTQAANIHLADVYIFTDTRILFWANVLLLFVVPFLLHLLFQLTIVTAASFVVLLFVPGFVYRTLKNKRLAKFESQLPDAFMMLSSSLQAGASLNTALEDLVDQAPDPLNQEFGFLIRRLRLGATLEDALIELERRIPLPSFIMASSAIRISREVGGNLVSTINNMAHTLRRKKTMEGKIDSLTAQGRAQGMFMAMLPIFLAIILGFLEPEAMRQLFTTRHGIIVLSIMVFMEVLGFFFIKQITRIDT